MVYGVADKEATRASYCGARVTTSKVELTPVSQLVINELSLACPIGIEYVLGLRA